ncbi:hypothetical protein VNO80_27274 [Phaseolus coccineus]|uniref:Uncharacterized protein n=1 Tax=Phaseolus coccineus TaxID=3886 RepID=A0AAN9QL63_PHACN
MMDGGCGKGSEPGKALEKKKRPNSMEANLKAQYQKGPIENGTQHDVHPKLESILSPFNSLNYFNLLLIKP